MHCQEDSSHNDLLPYDSALSPSECPPGPALSIACGGLPNGELVDGSALCEQLQPQCLEEEKDIDEIKEEEQVEEQEEEGRMQEQDDMIRYDKI